MVEGNDWRATHRALSEQDLRYREIAASSPVLLDRASFPVLEENKELLKYRLQPWLTFLGPEKLAEFKRVSLGIFKLLESVPQRLFGKDMARLAEFYDLGSPLAAEILFSPPTGLEAIVSRGDFIDTAEGFKCIEFNFTPNLGGWETPILVSMHMSIPPTAAVLAELDIEVAYTDTMLALFRHLLAHCDSAGLLKGGVATFAFVLNDHDPVEQMSTGNAYLLDELRKTLTIEGRGDLEGEIVVCRYRDLAVRREGVFLGAKRVHAVLEFCETATPIPIYRAFKAGQLVLLNGPMDPLLSTKRNVALLSQYAGSGAFDADERAFIERHVPWTRLVAPGTVEFEGEVSPLTDLLIAQREKFVLKDAGSSGGKGVVIGRFSPAEEWRKSLDEALASNRWVVQQHQESLPYLYQSGRYGCSVHDVIWGPFVFGDKYAGAILRMQPKADGGAVNLSLHATEGIILEV